MDTTNTHFLQLPRFFDRLVAFVAGSVALALSLCGIMSGEPATISLLLGGAGAILVYVATICFFVISAILIGTTSLASRVSRNPRSRQLAAPRRLRRKMPQKSTA